NRTMAPNLLTRRPAFRAVCTGGRRPVSMSTPVPRTNAMPTAEILATLAAGGFFLTSLLTGVWKYRQIHRSERAEAHPYVNIAHRTALLYSFACLLLAHFTRLSQLDGTLELIAVAAQVLFFALA